MIKGFLGGDSALGDRSALNISKYSANVNSDLGNVSFWVEIRDARHVERWRWGSWRIWSHQLIFFHLFETLFTPSPLLITMPNKTSPAGESAGGRWSTSKSTCVVPAWTLTLENASFGVRASRWSHQPTSEPRDVYFFESACEWSLACVDLWK